MTYAFTVSSPSAALFDAKFEYFAEVGWKILPQEGKQVEVSTAWNVAVLKPCFYTAHCRKWPLGGVLYHLKTCIKHSAILLCFWLTAPLFPLLHFGQLLKIIFLVYSIYILFYFILCSLFYLISLLKSHFILSSFSFNQLFNCFF